METVVVARAMCWGVHMQRMDERMTRACATRAHTCADVVPTVVRLGRAGEGAAVGRAGGRGARAGAALRGARTRGRGRIASDRAV